MENLNKVAMFFLLSQILSLNILMTTCQPTCDCQEIDKLKEIVQKEELERNLLKDYVEKELSEQKMETLNLQSEIRRMKDTHESILTSVETTTLGLEDRLEKVETNVADIDVKLNKVLSEQSENNLRCRVVTKALMSEKQRRIDFVSEMENQITDLKGTTGNSKSELNSYNEKCIANVTATQEYFRQEINANIRDSERQTDLNFTSVTPDLNNTKQTLLEMKTSVSTMVLKDQMDRLEKIERNVADIEVKLDKVLNEQSEDTVHDTLNNIKQTLLELNRNISTLNSAVMTDKVDQFEKLEKKETNVADSVAKLKKVPNEHTEDHISTLSNTFMKDKIGCGLSKKDVIFILDASTSVTGKNFVKMRNFLKDFLKNVDIDSGSVRVGVILYSTEVEISFHLNDFKKKAIVMDAIDKINYIYGSTNTADALKAMRDEMFVPSKGDRSDAPNICILLTDGVSNINNMRTIPEAEISKDKGINIYVIGIGLGKTREIKAIASRPLEQHLHTTDGFEDLAGLEQKILRSMCPEPL